MIFPYGKSHQQATAPMQSYVKSAGAGQTPNPFSSALNPFVPGAQDRRAGRNSKRDRRRKKRGRGDRRAKGATKSYGGGSGNANFDKGQLVADLGGSVGGPGGDRRQAQAPGIPGEPLGQPKMGIPGEQGSPLNPFTPKMMGDLMAQMEQGRFSGLPLEPTFMALLAQLMGGGK